MQSLTLMPHPANPGDAISRIIAIARRRRGEISVSFRALGRIDDVLWPIVMPSGFSEGLWRHSCFEAFVGVTDDPGYVELNMSPSRRWAAYRFDGYRNGMRRAEAVPIRSFIWYRSNATLMTRFAMPDLPQAAEWRLGLSAVIETRDGERHYFALDHAPGNPDFHNSDCFTARLPPPNAS